MQRRVMLWLQGVVLASGIMAQPDTLSDPAIFLEDVLQDRSESVDEFDFNTLFDPVSRSRKRKLNLNDASEEDLQASGLLTNVQISHFLAYRDLAGPLLAIYELQAIPGFELDDIRTLLPHVTVASEFDDLHLPLRELITKGRNDIFFRWRRQPEAKKGASSFEGDPNQVYFRFRHSFEGKFSVGFTGEKDQGEAFFGGSNPHGFDFNSAHLFFRDYNRRIRALALGDFSVSLGQGLILNNGFGYGKGPSSMSIKRGGRSLSPFTSVNEASFFRGAGATIAFGKGWESTLFLSSRRRDANLSGDTTLSSLLLAGLHRTESEIVNERAFRLSTGGGSLKKQFSKGHISLNAVADRLDKPLIRKAQNYNLFYFSGDRLLNVSADYAWRLRNLHFFGETGFSSNGAPGTVNGLMAGLDRKVDVSLLIRHYSPRFQTLHGTPFAETSGANNESGFYLGLEVRPFRGMRINGFFDTWTHPWLRFQTDLPSLGHEWLLRLTLFKKRSWEAYWQIRGETKERNTLFPEGKTNQLGAQSLFFSRLHFSYRIGKSVEWRTRLETGRFHTEGAPLPQTGMLFYQDFLFKPVGFPLSFTTRFGLFDTDGYDVRFYAYENGLLYNFAIPAYYDRGARFYLNVRYKGIRNLTIETRYATSFFPGNQEIGTGPDATIGDTRTDLGAQIKWSF